jgi:hypothetical protein
LFDGIIDLETADPQGVIARLGQRTARFVLATETALSLGSVVSPADGPS